MNLGCNRLCCFYNNKKEPSTQNLLTTASSQAQIACTTDRLRDLPDEVAHHILSFLSIRDLTRLCSVSKRFRELYLSTPSLNFYDLSYANISTCDQWRRLLACLDRILVKRENNKIQSFRFHWRDNHYTQFRPCCHEDLNCRTIKWIHNAVRCNVGVLDLQIYMAWAAPDHLVFPSCVFLCGSLKHLHVDMTYTVIETPPLASYSSLEYLNLRNVRIPYEGFFKWISYSCKCIKELWLDKVHGVDNNNITIESSSLESFHIVCNTSNYCNLNISGEKLEDIHIFWGRPSYETLTISAPNLKILEWSGMMMKCETLGELMSLEEAKLWLSPGVEDFDSVLELFWSIRRVKVLVLTEMIIKFLFIKGLTPAELGDVCYLRIDGVKLLDYQVPAMVSLFKGMPTLSSLYLKASSDVHSPNSDLGSDQPSSGFHMRYWKLQNLPFINQLKDVTIELSQGCNGIVFARYILEHAQNLEKMVLHHLPNQSNVVMELKSKMISNAQVVFQGSMEQSV